jgi:hypothetical protein
VRALFQNGTIKTYLDFFEYLDNQTKVEESLQYGEKKRALDEQKIEIAELMKGRSNSDRLW